MKYYRIEVERTYTTEVFVKCKDEDTIQNVLDAASHEKILFDAQTNLWDYIFEEEMQQCYITDQVATVLDKVSNPDCYFDLDSEIIEDNA